MGNASVFKHEFKNGSKTTCEITIGGSCATDGPADCKFENQECQDPSKDNAAVTTKGVAGAVCGCKAPFVDNMMGACENGPGAECAKDSDCPASLKLLCEPATKNVVQEKMAYVKKMQFVHLPIKSAKAVVLLLLLQLQVQSVNVKEDPQRLVLIISCVKDGLPE